MVRQTAVSDMGFVVFVCNTAAVVVVFVVFHSTAAVAGGLRRLVVGQSTAGSSRGLEVGRSLRSGDVVVWFWRKTPFVDVS